MEGLLYFGVTAVLIVGSAYVSWWLLPDERTHRAMRAVPLRRIAECVDRERVRVVGTVEARTPIAAPLTSRPCVYWRVIVRGIRHRRWVTLIDESEGVDFLVRDGASKALVRTEHITSVLGPKHELSRRSRESAAAALDAFLNQRGYGTETRAIHRRLQFYELSVQEGGLLCVVAVGRWEREPDEEARAGSGYREAARSPRLVLQSPGDGPLFISDHPRMTQSAPADTTPG